MKRREENVERLIERRREVEERLASLRAALASETGRAPRGRGWSVAVVAAAVGLALATRRRSRSGELAASPGD